MPRKRQVSCFPSKHKQKLIKNINKNKLIFLLFTKIMKLDKKSTEKITLQLKACGRDDDLYPAPWCRFGF